MKITPAKDYKKPLYAIGVATAVMMITATGCTDPAKIGYAGGMDVRTPETEDDHHTKNNTRETVPYCKNDADETVVLAGEVAYDGGEQLIFPDETEDDFTLAGDIAIIETE